jgi:uncharacterized protein (DUF2235 family)
MPKNIVVCCDGTANEFAANNTNVVKLYSTLDHDPTKQVTSYHPGLGTMEPAGALTTFTRRVTKLLGMAFGYGLCNDIRDAYVFLMQNYAEGDKVFLFGFSRGAYTARCVTGRVSRIPSSSSTNRSRLLSGRVWSCEGGRRAVCGLGLG